MERKEKLLLAAAACVLLAAFGAVHARQTRKTAEYEIIRPGQGSSEERVYLSFGETEELFSVPVQAKERTAEETEAAFLETIKYLEEEICGENSSIYAITQELSLPEKDSNTGAKIRWKSDREEVVSGNGSICRDCLEEAAIVTLTAEITLGKERREQLYFLRVLPYEKDSAQARIAAAKEELLSLEEAARGKEAFLIPAELNGVAVSRGKKENGLLWFALLLPFGAAAVAFGRKKEKETEQKNRERELLAEYPRLVTKLTMYVGAGLTVRTAWERLAREYRKKCQKGGKRSGAYEELCITAGELQTGGGEAAAYETFGTRIGLRPYKRLAAILSGQVTKGSGGMKEALKEEVRLAWENHKEEARRKGEEAETKLLFPMLGMLLIVFCVVLLPAFYSFGF